MIRLHDLRAATVAVDEVNSFAGSAAMTSGHHDSSAIHRRRTPRKPDGPLNWTFATKINKLSRHAEVLSK